MMGGSWRKHPAPKHSSIRHTRTVQRLCHLILYNPASSLVFNEQHCSVLRNLTIPASISGKNRPSRIFILKERLSRRSELNKLRTMTKRDPVHKNRIKRPIVPQSIREDQTEKREMKRMRTTLRWNRSCRVRKGFHWNEKAEENSFHISIEQRQSKDQSKVPTHFNSHRSKHRPNILFAIRKTFLISKKENDNAFRWSTLRHFSTARSDGNVEENEERSCFNEQWRYRYAKQRLDTEYNT